MRLGDDTWVPGLVLTQTARLVGAVRGAAFAVRRGEHDCDTVDLVNYFPKPDPDAPVNVGDGGGGAGGELSVATRAADALRRFVVPCLAENREAVVEVPELASAGLGTYVLILLARDQSGVRAVGAWVVECRTRGEAERRFSQLQAIIS